jgi:hypothetical protein
MKHIYTAVIVAMMMLFAVFATGCATQADVDKQVADAKAVKQAEMDKALAEVNSKVDATNAENKALAEALAEAKALQEAESAKLATELAEAKKKLEEKPTVIEVPVSNGGTAAGETAYFVDEVSLTGDFAESIDSEDYTKLDFYSVKFDRKNYDVEETLKLSSAITPIYNVEDQNTNVFVQVKNKDAITYKLQFTEAVDFADADGEELSVKFLGQNIMISNFEDGEVTIYQGVEQFVKEGDSIVVGDTKVTLVTIGSGKALLEVSNKAATQSKVFTEDKESNVAGVDIRVSDILDNEDGAGFATITVALNEDVEFNIKDGDEYEADDNYDWVVEGTGTSLSAIGIVLKETYTDDDEVFALGQGIVLPNNAFSVTFDSIKNAEVKDIAFDLSSDFIDVTYDGKIEYNNEKVEDGSLVFNVASSTITFDYETKTDSYEDVPISNIGKLTVFQGDRELKFAITGNKISLSDSAVTYTFKYVGGDFIKALDNAVIVDKDDDRLVNNGDVVYKADLDEGEDTVTIGLVSDEEVELALKVK